MWARAQKHVPKNHEEIFIVGNTYATLCYRSIRNMNTIKIKRVPVSVITKFKLWRQGKPSTRGRLQVNAKVGLFYSTSTGNTEAAAEWIQEKFAKHGDIAAPVDICEANVSGMQAFDSLIVGAPTWNTGADEGRSGTAWDDVLDELGALNLKGKKVAIFGCGDSVAYGDYFCDAIEELHAAFEPSGAELIGKTNSENKKIEARSSGTHSSENLHDSSLFSSGDNEVAKGNESVHRPGSANKGERLELNLKNDGSKLFGNLFTIQTTSVPMIYAARMDTEGRIRGSILKGDSDVKTGQRPGLFDSEEQQLFHLAQQRKSVDSLYEHLQVCDVLPLSTKS